MGVNKPLLPKSPYAPGTFVGDHSRALERELQKLQLAVRQLREGRIEGVLALDAAPTGGLWAQGDIVQNSAPKRTITASTTFAVVGWQYTDEGSGTLTWAEMRFWESMAAGGGGTFAATSMTATTTGVGTSLYAGNAAGELTLRNLQAGSGISLTVSAGAVRITATSGGGTFAATSQSATNVGTGVGLYLGNPAGVLGFSTLKAGTDITISVSGNEVVIGYTGAGGGLTVVSITATSTGSGEAVYVGNSGTELVFRKLQEGVGISLTLSGGAIRISAPGGGMHSARAYLSLTASTTTVGWQKIPLDTVEYDTGGMWDAANTRFKPTRAGYYQINARLRTSSVISSVLGIGVNGSQNRALGNDISAIANSGSGMVYCNGTTDYLEFYVFTTTAREITRGTFDTYFDIHGPL